MNSSIPLERKKSVCDTVPCESAVIRPSRVAVLTGGGDRPYALGLANTLISQRISFDLIGSDETDAPELHNSPYAQFLNLRGDQRSDVGIASKFLRIILYYFRLLSYAASTKAKVFHILWNNKFEYFDRTFLLLYYRILGKRLLFTAHNVNIGRRDGNDSILNRATLRFQYSMMEHVFVHTERMKQELISDFSFPSAKISVIPFGLNSTVPNSSLEAADARAKLGLNPADKAILFFGNIAPYKGLEYLVDAMSDLPADGTYKLIIAGRPKGYTPYWESIDARIKQRDLNDRVIRRIEFIPDGETEIYFKAVDVLVLPYVQIFQSGVLFLAYNFGLPVIASDVGSLKEDIVIGRTGFVCEPKSSAALAREIERYFSSPLYQNLSVERSKIKHFALERYSWERVGEMTKGVYADVAGQC